MSGETRLTFNVDGALNAAIRRVASERGIDILEVLRRSFFLYETAHQLERAGLHIGFAYDWKKFDTRVTGL